MSWCFSKIFILALLFSESLSLLGGQRDLEDQMAGDESGFQLSRKERAVEF